MDYSFKDYENAVLDALAPLSQENGGYLKTLEAYSGEFGGEESLERFFIANFPAVLVRIVGAEYEPADIECDRQTVTVELLVCARSYRSQDNESEPGAYEILHDIRNLLVDSKLGLSIRPVMIRSEQELDGTSQLVFYVAQYIIVNDCV